MEQGGKGRVDFVVSGNVEHVNVNQTDPWTEVDGERSSVKTKHPLLSDPAVRQALSLVIDRGSMQEQLYAMSPANIVRVSYPADQPGPGETPDKYVRAHETLEAWLREGLWAREEQPEPRSLRQDPGVAAAKYTNVAVAKWT